MIEKMDSNRSKPSSQSSSVVGKTPKAISKKPVLVSKQNTEQMIKTLDAVEHKREAKAVLKTSWSRIAASGSIASPVLKELDDIQTTNISNLSNISVAEATKHDHHKNLDAAP